MEAFIIRLPNLSMGDYLKRLYLYARIDNIDMSITIILVEMFIKKNNLIVKEMHFCLLATALLLTIKLYSDRYMLNSYYASVFGVSLKKLNQMELAFCDLMNWELFIGPEQIIKKHEECKEKQFNYEMLLMECFLCC